MNAKTEPSDARTEPQARQGIELILLSVVGVGLGYATSVFAARLLGPGGFENYAVAVASLGLLSTAAEAGTGKYALKAMPGYYAAKEWGLASGYWRFSLRLNLIISALLVAVIAFAEGIENARFGDYPLGVGVLFLPAIALCGVGVDFVMANRSAVIGSLIARVAVPLTTLALLIAAGNMLDSASPSLVVAYYGCGSVVGILLCGIAFKTTSPLAIFSSPPAYRRHEWLTECVSFAVSAFLASWIFRVNILVMELLPVAESQVAYLAAAMETGCLILLVSKSTDKMFQPEVSVIIEQGDIASGRKLRRRRFMLIGSMCLAFLAAMFLFGHRLLRLYGAEFEAGYPALCFISVGACIATMFSLAPAYLRFRQRSGFVIVTTLCGAIAMGGLTVGLGILFGATGAGMAFCAVMSVMSIVYLATATRDFDHLGDE